MNQALARKPFSPSLIQSLFLLLCLYSFPAASDENTINPATIDTEMFHYLQGNLQIFLGSNGLESDEYRKKNDVIATPAFVKKAILSHEAKQATPYSPSIKALEKCQFVSQRVEIDNQPASTEWVVSTIGKDQCMQASPYSLKNFWLVQTTKKTPPTILLTSRSDAVFIYALSPRANNPFRVIARRMQNKTEGMEIMCETVMQYQSEQGYQTSKATVYTYRYDPMLSGKAWLPTTDHRYQCLQ
jgi:hypothetical protein